MNRHVNTPSPGWLTACAALLALGCSEAESNPEAAGLVNLEAPAEGQGFQLDQGEFVVESGREALYCMRLPIPAEYGPGPVYVRGVDYLLPLYTHHFFMSYDAGAVADPEPCLPSGALSYMDETAAEDTDDHAGVDGKSVFIGGVGRGSFWLPEGYAMVLDSAAGHFSTSHHVVNFGTEPAPMYGRFNVHTAPAEEVAHPVSGLNCLLVDIDVPAGTDQAVSGVCVAPFDLDLVVLGSHAHQYLQRFEMRLWDGEQPVGEPFYVSEDWDSPEIIPLDEPIRVLEGQGIHFTCHFSNPTDTPLTYGAGEYQEMCAIMSAYAYPKDRTHEIPPSLGTFVSKDGDWSMLFDTSEIDGPF